ncbi:hypothetical protein DENSPDRAFT_516891 [Dentipellis sp. KUC8613]|nr:hypothetical protein DENSPDRAFT_516891 [Dentipellis sp. KUC8613]
MSAGSYIRGGIPNRLHWLIELATHLPLSNSLSLPSAPSLSTSGSFLRIFFSGMPLTSSACSTGRCMSGLSPSARISTRPVTRSISVLMVFRPITSRRRTMLSSSPSPSLLCSAWSIAGPIVRPIGARSGFFMAINVLKTLIMGFGPLPSRPPVLHVFGSLIS